MKYDLKNQYDCPLFTNKIDFSTDDWEISEQRQTQKWRKNCILKEIYVYIQINPDKLNIKTKKPYQLIRSMSDGEIEDCREHYNEFIDFIKKTDMANG